MKIENALRATEHRDLANLKQIENVVGAEDGFAALVFTCLRGQFRVTRLKGSALSER